MFPDKSEIIQLNRNKKSTYISFQKFNQIHCPNFIDNWPFKQCYTFLVSLKKILVFSFDSYGNL